MSAAPTASGPRNRQLLNGSRRLHGWLGLAGQKGRAWRARSRLIGIRQSSPRRRRNVREDFQAGKGRARPGSGPLETPSCLTAVSCFGDTRPTDPVAPSKARAEPTWSQRRNGHVCADSPTSTAGMSGPEPCSASDISNCWPWWISWPRTGWRSGRQSRGKGAGNNRGAYRTSAAASLGSIPLRRV